MSFLLNRNQRIKYCDVISESKIIDTDVPRGSVLSVTLFTLYINDLLKTLPPALSITYADDVTIICHGDNQANAAANAVNFIASITKWAQENGLILNSLKSQAICISLYARKKFTTLSVLTFGATCITQEIKWANHAIRMQKSITKMLGVLSRFGSVLNTNCRCRILQAFILPKLSHCTPAWCWVGNAIVNALDTNLQLADCIALRQKTATLDRNLYEIASVLPFHTHTQYESLCRVNSLLFIDTSEPYLPSLITESDGQHTNRSASSYKFRLPEHNRSADEECFYYVAVNL